jgi:5-methylcytosine-specific restriction endonuclease McrA
MNILRRLFGWPIVNTGYKKVDHSEKKKRTPIPPKVRNEIWIKYHKESLTGICYCCGNKIHRYNGGWHCSHVIASTKLGPDTIDNLRTCCRTCNLSMGDQNLYAYIKEKKLGGPGCKNVGRHFKQNPSQENDIRTNNWGKKRK